MIIPNTRSISIPKDGPGSSQDINNFIDQVVTDIHGLSSEVNKNNNSIEQSKQTILDEIRFLKRKVSSLESYNEAINKVNATNGLRLVFNQSMYEVGNLSFFQNVSLRPVVDTTYGVLHLPVNVVEPKFYTNSITNTDVVLPLSVNIQVSSSFIDEGSSEATDHEAGASNVIEGNPANAFNGTNTSYWIRTVEFPASSDVTEVSCELIVTIPNQSNTYSNVLTIHPYPVGGIDITDISFSPDLTSAFVKLPHSDVPTLSNPITNAREQKFIFAPQDIDQVRIRIRQRNFIEENGKKIFRYGLQEVGLFLVEFEKSTSLLSLSDWVSQADSENIAAIYRVDAPAGFFFTAVNSFNATPNFTLEELQNRHIIFRIYDGDPSSGPGLELWNSNQTLPQNQSPTLGSQITLSGNITRIYVSVSMRFVEQSGGTNSPYVPNTSPYLKSFTLEYSLGRSF